MDEHEDGDWNGYQDGYDLHLAIGALRKVDEGQDRGARGPIDAIWRGIADGTISDWEAADWARIIANRVVKTVIEAKTVTNERPGNALKALGLFGAEDTTWAEQNFLELYLSFPIITENRKEGRKQHAPANLRKIMKAKGFYAGLTSRQADARIARLMEKITRTT